ncbi:MAG: hypothetical protein ACOH2M_23235 [Cypionkella sp.]
MADTTETIDDLRHQLRHSRVENYYLRHADLGFASINAASDAASRAVHAGADPRPNGGVVMPCGADLGYWTREVLTREAPHFFKGRDDGNAAQAGPAQRPKGLAPAQDAKARRDAATKALDAIHNLPSHSKKGA